MSLERTVVSLDFFGIAGNYLILALQNQSSNNCARKVAFNNLIRLAKACNLLPKEAEPLLLALEVNKAGTLSLVFTCKEAALVNVSGSTKITDTGYVDEPPKDVR